MNSCPIPGCCHIHSIQSPLPHPTLARPPGRAAGMTVVDVENDLATCGDSLRLVPAITPDPTNEASMALATHCLHAAVRGIHAEMCRVRACPQACAPRVRPSGFHPPRSTNPATPPPHPPCSRRVTPGAKPPGTKC